MCLKHKFLASRKNSFTLFSLALPVQFLFENNVLGWLVFVGILFLTCIIVWALLHNRPEASKHLGKFDDHENENDAANH